MLLIHARKTNPPLGAGMEVVGRGLALPNQWVTSGTVSPQACFLIHKTELSPQLRGSGVWRAGMWVASGSRFQPQLCDLGLTLPSVCLLAVKWGQRESLEPEIK